MEYGRILQVASVSNLVGGSPDICTMRISETAASPSKELYVKFADGTEKQLTGSGSGGIFTATNGLTKVGANVKMGGSLVENTTINFGAFELAFNGTMIQRGIVGANKIVGAGDYFSYVPSDHTLIFGQASAAQYNTLPDFSFVFGTDNGMPTAGSNLMIGGTDNDLTGVDSISESILIGTNNAFTNATLTPSVRWSDMSDTGTFNTYMKNAITNTQNSVLDESTAFNTGYEFTQIIGSDLVLNGSIYSIVNGDGISIDEELRGSTVQGEAIDIVASGGIKYSTIVGNAINMTFAAEPISSNILVGDTTDFLSGVYINQFIGNTINAVDSTLTGASGSLMNISDSMVKDSTDSILVGTLINITDSITDCMVIGGATFVSATASIMVGMAISGTSTDRSIIIGNGCANDNVTKSICIASDDGGASSMTAVDKSAIFGDDNTVSNTIGSMIMGSDNSINNATGSMFVGSNLSFTSGAAKSGIIALGLGSAAFIAATGGVIPDTSQFTIFFENAKSLTPGAGIALTSPDGLTTKIITIDNAGAIALL